MEVVLKYGMYMGIDTGRNDRRIGQMLKLGLWMWWRGGRVVRVPGIGLGCLVTFWM